jgi:hypothetical protein
MQQLLVEMAISHLAWILTFLLIGSATATDIPFVFDGKSSDISSYTSDQLKKISAILLN